MTEASPAGVNDIELALTLVLDNQPYKTVATVLAVSLAWQRTALELLSACQTLNLTSHRHTVTDKHMAMIVARMPSLRTVNLSGCNLLSDKSLVTLKAGCPDLVELNLSCMKNIHASAVEEIVNALGDRLTSLELAGCGLISEADMVTKFSKFLELDDDEDGLDKVQG